MNISEYVNLVTWHEINVREMKKYNKKHKYYLYYIRFNEYDYNKDSVTAWILQKKPAAKTVDTSQAIVLIFLSIEYS